MFKSKKRKQREIVENWLKATESLLENNKERGITIDNYNLETQSFVLRQILYDFDRLES